MPKKTICDVKYSDIIHETDHAVLFLFGDKEVWLPKAWFELDETGKAIVMPQNRVEEKDLEDYVI